jgi:hypothetical protein
MRGKDGVAGFFEDLPVLLFVLMGVTVLVASAAWASRENADRELEKELDETARHVVRALLGSVLKQFGPTPRVSSLDGVDILSIVSDEARGYSFSVTVSSLCPASGIVRAATAGEVSTAVRTGFASLPFNALDERGLVVILEVRTIVW